MTEQFGETPERRRTQEVAEEYRRKGYDVIIEPKPRSLPEFLRGFRPDMLAQGDGDNVVIEVASRAALARPTRLRELARTVDEQPGWRFELVVANPEEAALAELEEGRSSYTRHEVSRVIKEADLLSRSQHPEAALQLAWAGTEATLRLMINAEGIPLRRYDPPYLLKQLAIEAAISRDEYDVLMQALRSRNAVAHGFTEEEGVDLVNRVQMLLKIVRRLLRSLPNNTPA